MNKKDINKIPIGELLITSVRIKDESYGPQCYKNNLLIKIKSIIYVHTIRKIPGIETCDYYDICADIYGKELHINDGDIFEFFPSKEKGLFYERFNHKHILKYKLWTPEDAPLMINWEWLSHKFKKIAFSS